MKIVNCKVNRLTAPLGYAMKRTVFSWTVEESAGKAQQAARIQVFEEGAPVYDSGWADLDSLAAPAHVALKPRTRYSWTVAVRSDAGEEAQSGENFFETGKMDEPWQAKWIGCDDSEPRLPRFETAVSPKGKVTRARLYITGLGLYEASWNGEKIGEEFLAPYCTNYNAWVQVQTYDVTGLITGAGTLSVLLGNGWYKGRFGFDNPNGGGFYGDSWKLLAELRLLYEDGSEEVIGTDESWQVTRDTLFFSDIYDGERRDDTLRDLAPVPARLCEAPAGALSDRMSTPVQVREMLPVKEIIHTPAGEIVLDLGQNLAGSFCLRLPALPAGSIVRLQVGEVLQGGNFYNENLRSAKAEYIYTCDGQPHVLQPKFTFYGYRYVKVTGYDAIRAEDFTALVYYSELPSAGSLITGNKLINQLIHNARWGQKGNFIDVPTDCPQRDERMGWTGDAQVFSPTACYQRDSYAFFAKYLHDMWTEQQRTGGEVPMVIPAFGHDGSSTAWGDAAAVIPWTVYEHYGDKSILEDQLDSMMAWVDYITAFDGDNHAWRSHFHFGDWLALDGPGGPDGVMGGTDVGYIADAYYRRSALLTAQAAQALGKTDAAKKYFDLADRILADMRKEYFTETGRCAIPTQTGYLLALDQGIAEDQERMAADLVTKLGESEGMLRTGFVGTPLLCPVLTDIGRDDMAFDLLLNEEYPGWLYCVKLGATTIWERWNSINPDGSISSTGMNSLNHYSYGSIVQWMYEDVAGIAPAAPGFRAARLAPHPNWKLGSAKAEYRSAAGAWTVQWEILENGDLRYRCVVPFGCTAQLSLPRGGGEYSLQAGEFTKTYTPDSPWRKVFSADMTVTELFQNKASRNVLSSMLPGSLLMAAGIAPDKSLRQIALANGLADEETLARVDEELAAL